MQDDEIRRLEREAKEARDPRAWTALARTLVRAGRGDEALTVLRPLAHDPAARATLASIEAWSLPGAGDHGSSRSARFLPISRAPRVRWRHSLGVAARARGVIETFRGGLPPRLGAVAATRLSVVVDAGDELRSLDPESGRVQWRVAHDGHDFVIAGETLIRCAPPDVAVHDVTTGAVQSSSPLLENALDAWLTQSLLVVAYEGARASIHGLPRERGGVVARVGELDGVRPTPARTALHEPWLGRYDLLGGLRRMPLRLPVAEVRGRLLVREESGHSAFCRTTWTCVETSRLAIFDAVEDSAIAMEGAEAGLRLVAFDELGEAVSEAIIPNEPTVTGANLTWWHPGALGVNALAVYAEHHRVERVWSPPPPVHVGPVLILDRATLELRARLEDAGYVRAIVRDVLYVDVPGGLGAFTLDGAPLWRFELGNDVVLDLAAYPGRLYVSLGTELLCLEAS